MQKFLSFGLVLLLGIGFLGGCGKNVTPSENSGQPSSEGTKASAASNGDTSDDYFTWDGDAITGLTETGKEQTELVIPDTAKSIGMSAFLGNTNLTSVSLGAGLEEIGESAFYMCGNLTEISFPSSLKKIGRSAFCKCESLQTVTFSKGLEEIGEYAFSSCKILTKIELPEGLTSLGKGVFYPCTKLNTIYLPASLENIPASVFGLEKKANLYVKEGSWADLHYSEFIADDIVTKSPEYGKNFY